MNKEKKNLCEFRDFKLTVLTEWQQNVCGCLGVGSDVDIQGLLQK